MAIMRFSDAAAHAMLDGTGGLIGFLNTGAGVAQINYYNGTMVATGDTAIGSQVLLATLDYSDPVEAGASATRKVVFDPITTENAVADGVATFAIVLNANGDRAWACDVGNLSSTAAIKLGNTTFTTGLPVGLTSAEIAIPATITT